MQLKGRVLYVKVSLIYQLHSRDEFISLTNFTDPLLKGIIMYA